MDKGKILIIDDSILVRNYLSKIVNNHPQLELCDTAANGTIGFTKILHTQPDVVILDLEMAEGDGLYVLQKIEELIPKFSRPFVLIYSSRARHDDPLFRKAIDFGFCDFVLKITGKIEEIIPELTKIFIPKIISGIQAKRMRSLLDFNNTETTKFHESKSENSEIEIPEGLGELQELLIKKPIHPKILIFGASTGGPQAVREAIENLGPNVNIPIVVIQHMPETFTKSFASELGRVSGLPAYELQHNMSLEKGSIYVFPGGMHGRLNSFGTLFVYYSERKEFEAHPFKPSINLAIEHLLGSFNGQAICAILSGMGKDGAIGAKNLHKKGSFIIIQDKQSSAVWGMPQAVLKEKAADIILSQKDIGVGIKMILDKYPV